MQVFRTALRVFFSHPVYILIYIFFLSIMGVFVGTTAVPTPTESDFEASVVDVAVIDRDGSDLSEGLTEFIASYSHIVEVEDTRKAMQDAAAQDYADYILIIPANFGEQFVKAAEEGTNVATLETITGYESISAHLMGRLVDGYLNTCAIYLSTNTATTQSEAVAFAEASMENEGTLEVMQKNDTVPVSRQWMTYMMFSGYTIMVSIIVCVGVVMSAFNRTEIRRRDVISPLSTLSMNLQIAAATLVITLICWAWVCIFGLMVFGGSLSGIDLLIVATVCLSLLAYCGVPLSIGFFLGLVTNSELMVNAIGNILGLAFSFLGGIWISSELMSDTMVAVAHFIPTFYYGDAISQAVDLSGASFQTLAPILQNIGIMLLFALSIFTVALVAGRLRVQSAEAGGNAAAAVVRT